MFSFDYRWYRSLQDLLHLAADFQPFPHKLQDPGRLGTSAKMPPESIEASSERQAQKIKNKQTPPARDPKQSGGVEN